jgi:hypothetical protein
MSSAINFDLAPLEYADAAATNDVRWVTVFGPVTGKGRWVHQTSCVDAYGIVEIRLEPYGGPLPKQQCVRLRMPWPKPNCD